VKILSNDYINLQATKEGGGGTHPYGFWHITLVAYEIKF